MAKFPQTVKNQIEIKMDFHVIIESPLQPLQSAF